MLTAVIGTVFVDIKGFPDGKFIPAGRNSGRIERVHGGVARNVAEDVRALGGDCLFVSLVDESGEASEVLARLEKRGIDTRYVGRTPDGMGTWLAVFDEHGDVFAAISRRPVLAPIVGILEEKGDEIFSAADSILFEIDVDPEIDEKVFELAEKYGKKVYGVVSNISIAAETPEIFSHLDCFTCNELEAGILFGEKFDGSDPDAAAQTLSRCIGRLGLPRMVVTLGENGSVWADADGERGYCPAEKIKMVDSTGAGDAFFSGLSVGLTLGKSIGDSCRIGTRLAASVITEQRNVCTEDMRTLLD